MNRRMLYQGISAISLAVFALTAGAQTSSSSPTMTTPPATSAVTSTPPSSNAASQAATEKAARVAKHGGAHAAANPPQAATSVAAPTMAACNQLPASRREFCRSEAEQAEIRAAQASVNHTLSNSQKAAQKRADAHYRAALAVCSRMPVSDRTTCVSEAGDDRTLAANE